VLLQKYLQIYYTFILQKTTLAAEKKKLYSDHHAAKNRMQEILMAKQNVEMLLNYHNTDQTKTTDRVER